MPWRWVAAAGGCSMMAWAIATKGIDSPEGDRSDSFRAKMRPLTQIQANEVVSSFHARSFTCADGYLGIQKNSHWQTIVGTGSLKKAWTGKDIDRDFACIEERFVTPDGDFFDVEYTAEHFKPDMIPQERDKDDTPMVIILHGLEANAKGTMVTKMCEAYMAQGFACVLVSFRGCSGEPNKTPGGYHVGFTNDVNQLTKTLQRRWPKRKMYLSGFSLGGNVSLKFLGELGVDAAEERNIFGAVTMSVPYDAVGTGGSIDKGINRYIYAANFLKTLKVKAEKQHVLFPNAFSIERVRASTTIGDYDDSFVAPIYGFTGKNDYYTQSGSISWIPKIRVPAICISAKDDPFIPEYTLPHPTDDVKGAPVRLIYHENGGHCGFIAKPGSHGSVVEQQQEQKQEQEQAQLVASSSTTSAPTAKGDADDRWIAVEMARAMRHIHSEGERITKNRII